MSIDADGNTGSSIFNFALWLLWIVLVTMVLGGIAYLFVGGSRFFSDYNTPPVVLYRQVDTDAGIVSVNGSIVVPSECNRLGLNVSGDKQESVLNFTIENKVRCSSTSSSPMPETFFAQFDGDRDTKLRVKIDSLEQDVILK